MSDTQQIFLSQNTCEVDCTPISVGKNFTIWVEKVKPLVDQTSNQTQTKLEPRSILSSIMSILDSNPSKQKFEAIAKSLGTPQVHEFLQYNYPLGLEQSKSVDKLISEYHSLDWSNKESVKRYTSNYSDLDDDVVRLHFLSRSTGGGEPIIAGGQVQNTFLPMDDMPLLWARDLNLLGIPSRTIGHINAIKEGVRAYSETGDPLYVNPRSHEFITDVGIGVELGGIAAGGTATRFRIGGRLVPKAPLKQAKINEILSTPKGMRPQPNTYLIQGYIKQHLAIFDEGSVRIVSKKQLEKYGSAGPDPSFVMPKSYVDKVIKDANGDMNKIDEALGLGLPKGFLDIDDLVLVEIPTTKGIKIPTGNEPGANKRWIPGGITSGGIPEAVTKLPPLDKLTIKPLLGE